MRFVWHRHADGCSSVLLLFVGSLIWWTMRFRLFRNSALCPLSDVNRDSTGGSRHSGSLLRLSEKVFPKPSTSGVLPGASTDPLTTGAYRCKKTHFQCALVGKYPKRLRISDCLRSCEGRDTNASIMKELCLGWLIPWVVTGLPNG